MNTVECEACRPKGPAWPVYLDFSKLAPYQKCCAWCSGTKQVTPEVAAVYYRLKTQPSLLHTRVISLMGRFVAAKKAWQEVKAKKRPKGHSETAWAAMLASTEQASKLAHADVLDAVWEQRRIEEDG